MQESTELEPEPRLTRNAIRCLSCNTVIESKHRHDFKYCECRNYFIDGGLDYRRMGGVDLSAGFEDLAEYGNG